jgi:hypothetical protein
MRLTPPRLCLKARDATHAEYDRFGGVGIAMARPSKSPATLLLPEYPIQVLLLRANDLLLASQELRRVGPVPGSTPTNISCTSIIDSKTSLRWWC